MAAADRVARIRRRLEESFAPVELMVEDDSHKHAGHAGAAGGLGHFSVRIVAGAFRGLSSVARHRQIYAALADLLKTDIHALSIDASAPADQAPAGEAR
jgi:BolA protein